LGGFRAFVPAMKKVFYVQKKKKKKKISNIPDTGELADEFSQILPNYHTPSK
jgi:hypothetical protein